MTRPTCTSRRSSRKVAHTLRLSPETLIAAKRILGTRTATETIEAALAPLVLPKAQLDGNRALPATIVTSPDA
ncbi:MAG: hypothetical protein IT359_01155 [Gemmatimonadaceae bacterium]|nr:hypothetical protein [Gemmatimonadaceae bacterium]